MRRQTRATIIAVGGIAGALLWWLAWGFGALTHFACHQGVPPSEHCLSQLTVLATIAISVGVGAGVGALCSVLVDAVMTDTRRAPRGFGVTRATAVFAALAVAWLSLLALGDTVHGGMEPENAARRRCAVDGSADGVNLSPCVLAEMRKSELEVLADHAPSVLTAAGVWIGASVALTRRRMG